MIVTPRVAVLAAALFAVPCQAQNFLANPDFENGLTGWNQFGAVSHQTSAPPQYVPLSGSGLCSLTGNGGAFNVSGIFQSFPANAGDQFTIDSNSYHWGGDPIVGSGPPNANWAVMKMAFFDASNVEIGGAEGIIMDGSFPTDTWVDNPAVNGTAPAGTVRVEALFLFLQPQAELGSFYVDDVFFTGPSGGALYPGTGEDLLMSTGINFAPVTGGSTGYVKTANPGDAVEVNVSSPGTTYHLFPYFLVGQLFTTGNPPVGSIPGVVLDLNLPIFTFVSGAPLTPLGGPVIGPLRGSSYFFTVPPGLSGGSLMLQAFVADPGAANGGFATSDGYEIQFQ